MEKATSSSRVIRVGKFELNARTGELSGGAKPVQLSAQPLQVLLVLLEHPGELVTREELIRRVWASDTFVDFEHGLNKAVNKLREALGDSAEKPTYIETLPRRGYRLMAPVGAPEESDRGDASPPPDHPADLPLGIQKSELETQNAFSANPADLELAGGSRRPLRVAPLGVIAAIVLLVLNTGGGGDFRPKSLQPVKPRIDFLAVLPLENLSGDPEQAYFADGMTDALITEVAKIGATRVISRTSVMRYKGTRKSIREIGRELNVDAVVEGTVTRSGDRVRITAQLIQVATDMHLWAETYERSISEVLQLQSEVATDIARRISAVVRPVEHGRTVNPTAYGLYLKGRFFFYEYTTEGWQRAIEHFTLAIESDPEFAPAYGGLADAYIVAGAYGAIPAQEALTRGKLAATKAIELDDTLASAHYALATAYTWYDWDWATAEKEFQRGLALNPNDALGRNWYGGYLSLKGRHEEALDEHERARDLDPFSLIINANLARSLYWGRRYDDAISQAKKTLQMDPKFGVALFWLEGSLRHRGMFKEAVALRQAFASPENAQAIARKFQTSGFSAILRDDGEAFQKDGALVEAARCFAQIGDKEKALTLLEDCYHRRCSSMVTLKAEPDFDGLRTEPRYKELEQGIGLRQF